MKFVGILFMLFALSLEAKTVIIEENPVIIAENGPLVQEAPPEPMVEVRTECPSCEHVWVPGFWRWEGRWCWEKGCWKVRPHAGACWVPGHWEKHHKHHGWYWVPGHWG